MESVHYLMKVVSGAPNIRPAWFFDTAEQGEGLNDIGTHLVDLVQWTLFPDHGRSTIATDVQVRRRAALADHDPAAGFPAGHERAALPGQPGSGRSRRDTLEYYCNTLVPYTLRGIHTKLNVIWDWEPPAGSGDTHFAFYRGHPRARRSAAGPGRPLPAGALRDPGGGGDKAQVLAAAQAKIKALQDRYPGVTVEDRGAEIHITIPDAFRVGHEAHFAQVTANFLDVPAQPERAAGVGTAEHAGEVLRDDEGHRNEPTRLFPTSASARALIGFLRRESFANQNL